MKAIIYLLLTALMMSFWFGVHTVSGNQVISKKDTLVFIHNLESDFSHNLTFSSEKEISVKNSLYAKVDTTKDDYIFISIRLLAIQQERKTEACYACMHKIFGNTDINDSIRVIFFDNERIRKNI
jgi:hypothetical protein